VEFDTGEFLPEFVDTFRLWLKPDKNDTLFVDLRTFMSVLVNKVSIVFMVTLIIILAMVTVIIFIDIFTLVFRATSDRMFG
jgi:hypothetical protein